jgi:DinB superfamily
MHDLVVRDLEQARNRTLGLTNLDDPTLVTQHDLLMSPLVWDLAHVGQREELWLLRAGDPAPARDAPAGGGRALRRVQAPPRRAPVAAAAGSARGTARRDDAGRRLTTLLDRPAPPALSDDVQRADRSLNVPLGKWALGSVRPFADVSRNSRSFAGG